VITDNYLMNYAVYVQYPILLWIIVYSTLTINKFKYSDVILVFLISIFGFISYVIGSSYEYDTNIRAIFVPFIFYITLNSKSYVLLKPLFIYCLTIVLFEEILYFTGLSFYSSLVRMGLLRPAGGFLDSHLNGIFLSATLYIFGRKYIGAFVAMISMSLQTPIAYSVAFINKKNIKLFIIFSLLVIYVLYEVGHLKIDQPDSMINAYLALSEYEFDNCYVFGCSSNNIMTIRSVYEAEYRFIDDIGFIRVFYFFGVPWLLTYTYLVFKKSNSFVVPLMYFMTILHYPVVFGLLTSALMGISINYMNRKIVKNDYRH